MESWSRLTALSLPFIPDSLGPKILIECRILNIIEILGIYAGMSSMETQARLAVLDCRQQHFHGKTFWTTPILT